MSRRNSGESRDNRITPGFDWHGQQQSPAGVESTRTPTRKFIARRNRDDGRQEGMNWRETKAAEKAELSARQGGVSPLTGEPLHGRLERHHVQEKHDGGGDGVENKQLIPITEHVAEHFSRAYDPNRSPADQLREFQTAMGRVEELNKEELDELNELIPRMTGRKVRFIG